MRHPVTIELTKTCKTCLQRPTLRRATPRLIVAQNCPEVPSEYRIYFTSE